MFRQVEGPRPLIKEFFFVEMRILLSEQNELVFPIRLLL